MFGQLETIYEPFITELIGTLDSNKSLKAFLIRDKKQRVVDNVHGFDAIEKSHCIRANQEAVENVV